MRPTATLLRLYPARWRARYGDEFAALLEERPLGPFDVADILLGALDAHLHLRGFGAASQHAKGFAMSLRIGGYAAIAGGALLFTSLAAGQLLGEGAIGFVLVGVFVATLAVLVALVGLSAFQARRFPRLVWAAFAIPAIGACISLVGLIGMVTNGDLRFIGDASGWMIWSIGLVTMIAGSALFGLATWRARFLSRPAAALLAVGALLVIPMIGGLDFLGFLPESLAPVITLLAILAFTGGWVGLGVSAIRVTGPGPIQLEGASL
jgi:hypothetical protein